MSAISAIMSNFYATMANNSAYSWMQAANSRMGLANSLSANGGLNGGVNGNVNFRALANADTLYELQMIQNSFSYRTAKAMQEAMEKLEKESKHSFDTFA